MSLKNYSEFPSDQYNTLQQKHCSVKSLNKISQFNKQNEHSIMHENHSLLNEKLVPNQTESKSATKQQLTRLTKLVKTLIIIVSFFCLFVVILVILLGVFYSKLQNVTLNQSEEEKVVHIRHQQQLQKLCKKTESEELAFRRQFVRNMTASAFHAYQQFAWGDLGLKPISKKPFNTEEKKYIFADFTGYTIVEAMSTLWVMGLTEEWAAGKEWIATLTRRITKLKRNSYSNDEPFSVSSILFAHLGGLLSAYALSGEPVFQKQAISVYNFLNSSKVFSASPAPGVLNYVVNFDGKKSSYFDNFYVFLTPELLYLSNLTQDPLLENWLAKSRTALKKLKLNNGTHSYETDELEETLDDKSWQAVVHKMYLYHNLISSYIQLGQNDTELLEIYGQAVDSALDAKLITTIDEHLYINATNTFDVGYYTGNYFCQLSSMFAKSSTLFKQINSTVRAQKHHELAVNIAESCHKLAVKTKTGLLQNSISLPDNKEFVENKNESSITTFLAGSYFSLYRLTGDPKYREWAWELALSLVKHCQTTSGGFSDLLDVNSADSAANLADYQPGDFFTLTLKYLYLIFEEDQSTVFPTSKWVFNFHGHPLPVPVRTPSLQIDSAKNVFALELELVNNNTISKTKQLKHRQRLVKKMAASSFSNAQKLFKSEEISKISTRYLKMVITNALSTLWIMDLKEEWESGKRSLYYTDLYIINNSFFIFDAISSYVGGILSAYALSGEQLFLDKIEEINNLIIPGFIKNIYSDGTFISNSLNFLNYGFQQPELIYFSNITQNKNLSFWLTKSRAEIKTFKLVGYDLNYTFNTSASNTITKVFKLLKDTHMYYNILRSYIQLGQWDNELLSKWDKTVEKTMNSSVLFKKKNGQLYLLSSFKTDLMDYTSCRFGGMFALSSTIFKQLNLTDKAKMYLEFAVNLTDTCHQVANSTKTKLLPYSFTSDNEVKMTAGSIDASLAETYFFLYKITGDEKYQEWAWELTQAIYIHCQSTNGTFYSIKDVNSVPTKFSDTFFGKSSIFVTLKYLYLTFSKKSTFSFDKWIFTETGQLLPVCGTKEQKMQREMCNAVLALTTFTANKAEENT